MRPSVRTFRDSQRSRRLRPTWARSVVRRLTVAASSAVLWALDGFEQDSGTVEREEAEVFSGIGFYARPKAGSRAEAVVLKVGGESGHGVVVATRDLDAQKSAGDGAEDETALFNTVAIVRVRADGTIEIGAHGGPFAALATKADIDALRSWVAAQFVVAGHTHTVSGATTTAVQPITPPGGGPTPPNAAGTQKLKAQ